MLWRKSVQGDWRGYSAILPMGGSAMTSSQKEMGTLPELIIETRRSESSPESLMHDQ
jgi:hypothetical protein